jgi:hypothetical protein
VYMFGASMHSHKKDCLSLRGGGGWDAYTDPSSGATYYFNSETQETSWTLPPGAQLPANDQAQVTGQSASVQPATQQEDTAAAPARSTAAAFPNTADTKKPTSPDAAAAAAAAAAATNLEKPAAAESAQSGHPTALPAAGAAPHAQQVGVQRLRAHARQTRSLVPRARWPGRAVDHVAPLPHPPDAAKGLEASKPSGTVPHRQPPPPPPLRGGGAGLPPTSIPHSSPGCCPRGKR